MRRLRLFFLLLLLFMSTFCTYVNGQEQLGLKLENFSGINSVLLNPALPSTSPFQWDINVISFAAFSDNNYAYVENAGVPDLRYLTGAHTRPTLLDNPELATPNGLVVNYIDDGAKRWASGSMSIMGPSFLLQLNSEWTFGIFTQLRIAGQVRKIPNNLSFYPYDATPRYLTIRSTPFRGATMAWGELGGNISRKIETHYGHMAFGGNVKLLTGFEAAFGNFASDFYLTKNLGDTLSLEGVDVDFGFTTSNADIYNSRAVNNSINGYGLGLDLGVQFVIEGDPENYQWKFGVSVLDIGRVAFRKNTELHTLKSDELFQASFSTYETLTNPLEVSKALSFESLGDSLTTYQDDQFKIWLPTALSLQGEYAFTDNIYLNAMLIQRIPIGEQVVSRDNLLALTPRFEHRWFAAMLPISVLNYEQLHVGFAARIAYLTIGTENFTSFIKQKKLTGSDFYLALKFNPFHLKESFGGAGRSRGGRVKCYDF